MSSATTNVGPAKAARIAGALYLFTMATSIFSMYFVRSSLIVRGEATQTAENILGSESLFRLGLAIDVITFAGVIALTWALYVLLRTVNREMALLGAFWRLAEATILSALVLHSLVALALLTDAQYLQAFDAVEVHTLARLSLVAHGTGHTLGFAFLGLGSTVFSHLLFQSRYVPRGLAAFGIFASLLFLVSTLWILLVPATAKVPQMAGYAAMFVFEVTLGFWLLIKGAKLPAPSASGG